MPQLHYLDLSDPHSNRALDELGQQLIEILGRGESVPVPQLQAVAEGLSAQPASSKACGLAKRIYEALEAHQQHLLSQPPAGFPLSQAEEEQVRFYAFAWRALGQAYARWWFTQAHPVEAGLLVWAIACLRQIVRLFGCYHRRLPKGLWLDVHTLFRQAQQAELSRAGKWQAFFRPATLQQEYFKAQLMGLVDPYGLLPQEVVLLDALLEKWAAIVRITDSPGEGWHLDRETDTPANWECAGHGSRLDLTRLAALFADHKPLATPLGRFESWHRWPETIPVGLLERLERYWFHPPSEPIGLPPMDCEWVSGLENIFSRLQGEATLAIPARIEAGWAEVTVRPGSLQVGDLIGVFVPRGELLGLARVARLEWSESAQALRVQLEAIQGKVVAVGIQPFYRARQPCAYQRGLLLAEAERLSLLLAEQPLPEGVVVRLLHGGKLYPVRLDERQNPARRTLSCRCVSAADLVQK